MRRIKQIKLFAKVKGILVEQTMMKDSNEKSENKLNRRSLGFSLPMD